jgi:phosphate starvation-inducible protein PhoH
MQSAEIAEIQALTTRIGEDCTLVICGDKRQNDVKKGLDGVTYIKKILDNYEIRDSGVIEFTMEDCVRSGICFDFLDCL